MLHVSHETTCRAENAFKVVSPFIATIVYLEKHLWVSALTVVDNV